MSDEFILSNLPPNVREPKVRYLLRAAIHSKYNAKHWARYLRKEIVNGETKILPEEVDWLMERKELSAFQKIFLKRTMIKGTPTYQYVKELNEPVKKEKLEHLMKHLANLKASNS